MNIETIDEPIAMLVVFSGGQCRPLRFRWGRRTLKVERVNARWTDRSGGGCGLHYSIQSGEETYFLHLDTVQLLWHLDKVVTS